jgi:hypothetical protein
MAKPWRPHRARIGALLTRDSRPPKLILVPPTPASEPPASPPIEGQQPGLLPAASEARGELINPLPNTSLEDPVRRDPESIAVSDPAPRIRRHRRDWVLVFLDVIRNTGSVRSAAEAAGVDRTAPYIKAKRDPKFAAAWAAAEDDAVDLLVDEGRRRALEGSDQLLMFFLKGLRPATYRESFFLRIDPRRQAQRVADRLGISVDEVLDEVDRRIREHRP